jgi:hypothetical protein
MVVPKLTCPGKLQKLIEWLRYHHSFTKKCKLLSTQLSTLLSISIEPHAILFIEACSCNLLCSRVFIRLLLSPKRTKFDFLLAILIFHSGPPSIFSDTAHWPNQILLVQSTLAIYYIGYSPILWPVFGFGPNNQPFQSCFPSTPITTLSEA